MTGDSAFDFFLPTADGHFCGRTNILLFINRLGNNPAPIGTGLPVCDIAVRQKHDGSVQRSYYEFDASCLAGVDALLDWFEALHEAAAPVNLENGLAHLLAFLNRCEVGKTV